jgi:predicted dehydrogenase
MTNVTPEEDPMGVAKFLGLPVADEPDSQTGPRAEAYRKAAREQHEDEGTLEVDDNAVVSFGDDDGAYVAAWVWVGKEEAGICRECGEVNADNGEGFDGLCGSCADKTEGPDPEEH